VYANLADEQDCAFVSNLACFDLEHVVESAYLQKAEVADDLLSHFISLPSLRDGKVVPARVRAKLILGAFFVEQHLHEQLERVKRDLAAVPEADISAAMQHLVSVQKRAYWEVTDRAINIEWTDKARRRLIRALAEELVGGGASSHGTHHDTYHDEHHEEHHDDHHEGHALFLDHAVMVTVDGMRPSVLGAIGDDDDA